MEQTSSLALFTTVALAHLLAVMSPGPDFAMVTRQTLAYGRGPGLWTAWGIATGIIFHVAYGLFGLGWLLQRYPALLEVLRYGGAAFLFYMGWGALRSQARDVGATAANQPAAATPHRHFGIGVVTNIFNPKAMLFFVALFSAVVTTQTPLALRLGLGLWIVVSTGAWFSFVALTLGHTRVRAGLGAYAHWIDRTTGAVLIALGLGMLIERLA
jgi:RhtB (resistance to homoserine/threonine) family protein